MIECYNLNDINKIIKEGFSYKLPNETINIIDELCNNMSIVFKKNKLQDFSVPNNYSIDNSNLLIENKNKQKKGKDRFSYLNKDWGFKASVIPKIDEFEQKINEIRIILNKITPKNIDIQYKLLIDYISSIFNLYSLESEEIKKIITIILEICSTNKFYSVIYADIYSRIILKYSVFNDYLQNFFNVDYLLSFNNINYIDCNIDYDGFCEYNKKNDIRKANTTFYIQMMKLGNINKQDIIKCIKQLLETIFNLIPKEGFINEVEEITENIYIFIKNTNENLSSDVEWENIIDDIEKLSILKHNSYPSLSNRTIFKYMDIID